MQRRNLLGAWMAYYNFPAKMLYVLLCRSKYVRLGLLYMQVILKGG
jgi:hypothetical protein